LSLIAQSASCGNRTWSKARRTDPDPKAWVLYLNGEEYARVERREDVAAAVLGVEGPRPRGLLSRVRGLLGGRR
jgi:hypothetical protein